MQGQSSTHVLTCKMTHDGYKGRCGPMITSGAASEDFLLALLNTTPVVDGAPADELADPARARSWLAGPGGGRSGAQARRAPGGAGRAAGRGAGTAGPRRAGSLPGRRVLGAGAG